MKYITLQRLETSDEGTFGTIEIDDHIFFTGELPKHGGNSTIENERSVDCIPEGEYEVIWSYSNRFKTNLYELLRVPGRSGIRIHTGNFCGNTAKGYKSDVEGCILIGNLIGSLNNQKTVINSKVAFKNFCDLMGTEKFKLKIIESF